MKNHKELNLVFGEAEAKGLGVYNASGAQREAIRRRMQCGEILSPIKGAYVRTTTWRSLTYEQQGNCIVKTFALLHPQWAFSGPFAAWIYGFSRTYQLLHAIMVAVPPRSHLYMPASVRKSYLSEGEEQEACVVGGIKVCSVARTLFDCARMLPLSQSLGLCDRAVRDGKITTEQLVQYVAEHRCFRGVQKAALTFSLIDPLSENGGESQARARMYELGFVLPQLQVPFEDPVTGQLYRVDFMWTLPDGTRIIGELDGRQKYVDEAMRNGRTIEQVLTDEKKRESRLSIYGIRLLRFGYDELRSPALLSRLLAEFGVPLR